MLRDHSNKWKQKHTSFWWKPLGTNHKLPHSSTLIVFLRENELFQRGWGVFVTLVEIPKGWGVISSLQKWKIQGGGGVLSEIPSVVGVWIFSGTTHFLFIYYKDEQHNFWFSFLSFPNLHLIVDSNRWKTVHLSMIPHVLPRFRACLHQPSWLNLPRWLAHSRSEAGKIWGRECWPARSPCVYRSSMREKCVTLLLLACFPGWPGKHGKFPARSAEIPDS